jgi:integrase
MDDTGHLFSESTGKRWDSVQQSREAKKLRAAKEVEERTAPPRERSERELNAWVPRWLASTYKSQENTLESYLGAFESLMNFLEEHKVRSASQITRKMCFDYIDWRQLKENGGIGEGACRNTAIHNLRVLRLILNEAINREHILKNPASKMGLKPDAAAEKPEITAAQRAAVEASPLPDWQRISWAIAINQGCRLAETSLPLSDVDFTNDTITFTIKGKRRHTTKLVPDLKPLLQELKDTGCHLTWGPFHRNASRDWSRTLEDLGMPFTFHSTRVTVITKLARAGVNEQQAIRFIGHCSSEVHAVYTRLKVDDLGACVQALSAVPADAQTLGEPARDRPEPSESRRSRKKKIGRPAKPRRA